MLFATDAASLPLLLLVVDSNLESITGITFDDADLAVSYKLQAGAAWVTPALVAGSVGNYLANSWVELGDGMYQWCPPAAALVAGTSTAVRVVYAANPALYDTIEPKLLPASVKTTVDAIASSLSGVRPSVVDRVSGGTITAFIDDDYTVRSGTELAITVADPSGVLYAKLNALGVDALSFGASREHKAAGEITGTIAALGYASNVLTISIEITACGSGLRPDEYTYQIQSSQEHEVDGETETDDFIELSGTLLLERRTVSALG